MRYTSKTVRSNKREEGELKSLILDYLSHINGRYFNISTGVFRKGKRWIRTAPKGTPDILGFNGKGYFVAIETKSKKGVLSDEQSDFRESILLTEHGIHIVAKTLEDVTKILR